MKKNYPILIFFILLVTFVLMGLYYLWNTNSKFKELIKIEPVTQIEEDNVTVAESSEIKHYKEVEWTERKSTFVFLDNGVVTPVEGTRIQATINENITENVRAFMDHYKSQMESQGWEYLEGGAKPTSESYSYKKGDKYLSYGYSNIYDDITDHTTLSGFKIFVTYN